MFKIKMRIWVIKNMIYWYEVLNIMKDSKIVYNNEWYMMRWRRLWLFMDE